VCIGSADAAAVEVHSAVEAAAAMQAMVSGWTKYTNRITVDPQAGCVSFQQANKCIIFSVGGGPRVQFVHVAGLPPLFIDVRQAQEVRGNANLNPATAARFLHDARAQHNAFVIARSFSAAAAALTI
jgi:hypothetical protein